MLCPICDMQLTDIPSGDEDKDFRSCSKCHCIWIYPKLSPVYRRMEDNEVLVNRNGKYYLRGN